MGYNVQDRIEVSLFLDQGFEYPLDVINSFDYIQLDCGIGNILPTCHFCLTDVSNLISTHKLIDDATTVSIVLKGMGTTKSKKYNFRVFHFKDTQLTVGTKWEVDGYWDCQKYWLTTISTGSRGTSSAVIEEYATTCGLKFEGIPTSDTQLWLPQNKTYGEAVGYMAQRGYVSDLSFMKQGVDLTGLLRYKDMNALGPPTRNCVQGEYRQGEIPIVDFAPKSTSGFNNKITGYNNAMRAQGVVVSGIDGADQTITDQISFTSDSRTPLFDDKTRTTQGRGYQLFGPLDFGNVHQAYDKARYQNMRYANLHNLRANMLTNVATDITLFDVINYSTKFANDEINAKYSGSYKVVGQTILVQAVNYLEMFQVSRHGTNIQPSNERR